MKFSANIGFLYTELPLPERIRAAKRDGFDAVECHFPYDVPEAEMKGALDETGFAMLGLNTVPGDVAGGDFGLAALAGRRDEAAAAVKQAVDYGAAIGAQNVHVMAGRTDGGAAAEAAYRETLSLACDLAREKGMGVLIEPINHRDVAGYHLSRVEHAAEIIEALGQDNLRIMFDCYHTQIMQGRSADALQGASAAGRPCADRGSARPGRARRRRDLLRTPAGRFCRGGLGGAGGRGIQAARRGYEGRSWLARAPARGAELTQQGLLR